MEDRDRLLNAFTSATIKTIGEMAGIDCEILEPFQDNSQKTLGDISAVIGLTASAEGAMALSFPELSAVAIARLILADVTPNPEMNLVRDCIAEIANVIVGQARGVLADTPYRFAMSTPTIISGTGHEIRHKTGMPCVVAEFITERGDFALMLCLGAWTRPEMDLSARQLSRGGLG